MQFNKELGRGRGTEPSTPGGLFDICGGFNGTNEANRVNSTIAGKRYGRRRLMRLASYLQSRYRM